HYLLPLIPALTAMWAVTQLHCGEVLMLGLQILVGLALYVPMLSLLRDPMYAEAKKYILSRFHRKNPM
ncbi:MAG: hypothetical protein K2M14_08100, partial [Muribaculaceae bacterium]|nr:hypothetical protein [Muribaculaceae bacterium]